MFQEIFNINNLDVNYTKFLLENQLWDEAISPNLDRFKILSLSYYNFDQQQMNDGQLIVFDLLAENTIKIFQSLFKQKFPLSKMNLTSDYNGDDLESMEDNNTSCFNCRKILNSSKISLHAYGMALDINPLQNPYIVNNQVFPSGGEKYLDRSLNFIGKVENILPIMKESIFNVWGGEWEDCQDYHHFQLSRKLAENIVFSSYQEGKILIKKFTS